MIGSIPHFVVDVILDLLQSVQPLFLCQLLVLLVVDVNHAHAHGPPVVLVLLLLSLCLALVLFLSVSLLPLVNLLPQKSLVVLILVDRVNLDYLCHLWCYHQGRIHSQPSIGECRFQS